MKKAKVLFDKGKLLIQEGDWARASEALREALDELEASASTAEARTMLSEILRKKAHADSRMSEIELATGELEHALDLSTELKDKVGMADALRGLGYVRILEGDAEGAMEHYRKALGLAEGTDEKGLVGRIRLEIGNVHFYKYDLERAKEEYGRALAILKAVGDDAELARVYNNLGEVHKATDDLEEGIEYHRRCIELSTKIGNITLKGFAALNAAECFIKMKERKFAREFLDTAVVCLRDANDRIGLANVWRIYGIYHLAEGDAEAAEKAFNKSIAVARATGLSNSEAEALRGLANALAARGRITDAKSTLRRAIKLFESTKRTKEAEEAKGALEKL